MNHILQLVVRDMPVFGPFRGFADEYQWEYGDNVFSDGHPLGYEIMANGDGQARADDDAMQRR